MKKAKIIMLPLAAVMAVSTFAACSPEINQGPEVSGASDITCLANTVVDLLSGVSALDKEDGDITPDLKITVTPEVAVQNGYAVFPEAGDYEVCYEVKDSGGKFARTTVAATVQEREVYMDTMLTNGFALKTGGSVKVLNSGLNGDVFAFKTQGQEIAEDVRLTRTYTLNTDVMYTFEYYFKSNIAGRIKLAADGKALEGNINVTEGENVVKFNYTAKGETENDTVETVEIELWMGGLEGDLEVEFTKAESVYYNAPEIEVIENTNNVTNFDFTGKTINRTEGASGATVTEKGNSATIDVFAPAGDDWKTGMFVNTGVTLEDGKTYYVSFDIVSELGNEYDVCINYGQWDSKIVLKTPLNGKCGQIINATSDWSSQGLWLFIRSGTAVNNITISNLQVVECAVKLTDKLTDFNFNGKIKTRFDDDKGQFELEGNIGVVEEGVGAYLEITKTTIGAGDNWRGGMFVETGFKLVEGIPYTVSYDVEAEKDEAFEVKLQKNQWDEVEIGKTFETGHNEVKFTANADTSGDLWIYVASGAHANKITIKNLKVQADESGYLYQHYAIGAVQASHNGDGAGSVKCEYGKITYNVESFGGGEKDNELESPAFNLSAAMGNYIITFKAKASQNVKLLFAPHVNAGWDPTLVWKEMKFTTEEQTFAIRCNDVGVNDDYVLLWRFGYGENTAYHNVTIEISDIQICCLSDLER
ncbi:MAG: hypothetical protein K2K38_01095 [Clostridia bacterium]|nr:hypothetical protein [Clostridia bacterium]